MFLPYLYTSRDDFMMFRHSPLFKKSDSFHNGRCDKSLTVTEDFTINEVSYGEMVGFLDDKTDYINSLTVHYLNADDVILKNVRCLPASPSLYL